MARAAKPLAAPAPSARATNTVPATPVAAAKPTAAPTLARAQITDEQIARRAYEIFLARGGEHGRHHDDWLQAERELKLGRQ